MNRSHFADADTDFIQAEPGPFAPYDGLVADLDYGREQSITAREARRLKRFDWHQESIVRALPAPAVT